ncbi:MAG: RluA family pseudouridine synthase [Myxococcales bacterium]|nr:RluA family pseudouridine synthase [Myxococcales bacterium]
MMGASSVLAIRMRMAAPSSRSPAILLDQSARLDGDAATLAPHEPHEPHEPPLFVDQSARLDGDAATLERHQPHEPPLAIVRPSSLRPDSLRKVLRVCPELAGLRLDRFVMTQLHATSRARTQRIVALGAFTPAGTPLRKNHRVRAEERVILWREPWDEPHTDVELPILFEDDAMLAIDKPPLIAVHPSARHHRGTVTSLLLAARPLEKLTLAHRLDKETSGVLLLAKTRRADRTIKAQFEARRDVEKRYIALVWGSPAWERHTCELRLELDPSNVRSVMMRVAILPSGLAAQTTFEVMGRRRSSAGRDYTLLRATLHTGRQHQIRVHLQALGLPVVGDKLYGPDEALHRRACDGLLDDDDHAKLELPRHALHAAELTLVHPELGHRVRIAAPLYPDIAAFWAALSEV